MKKSVSSALVLAIIATVLLVPATVAASSQEVRVVVLIAPSHSVDVAKERLAVFGDVLFTVGEIRAVVLRVPRSAINGIQRLPFVVHIEEDSMVSVYGQRARVRITDYTSSVTVYPGDVATVSFTIRNVGQTAVTVVVELRDPSSNIVSRTDSITLSPRSRYTGSLTFRSPTTPGKYYYSLVVVDAGTGTTYASATVEVTVTEPLPPPPQPEPSPETIPWNVELVKAPQVWSELSPAYGDASYGAMVQVAVVDTGVDYAHYDLYDAIVWCVNTLNGALYTGYNYTRCADGHGHGTLVVGVVAARINSWGIVGVAPKVAIYVVKALYDSGYGYYSEVALGIVEAVKGPDGVVGTDDDADVISMSFGGGHSVTLYNAILYAYNSGAVLVAAAGNSGGSAPVYPAAYPEVIAVGAIDRYYNVPSWSNRNPDVVAPGSGVISTAVGNRHSAVSGTSFACPHVSAAVALAQSARTAAGKPKLTPSQAIMLVRATAVDMGAPGYDELYGYGVLDARALVLASLSS